MPVVDVVPVVEVVVPVVLVVVPEVVVPDVVVPDVVVPLVVVPDVVVPLVVVVEPVVPLDVVVELPPPALKPPVVRILPGGGGGTVPVDVVPPVELVELVLDVDVDPVEVEPLDVPPPPLEQPRATAAKTAARMYPMIDRIVEKRFMGASNVAIVGNQPSRQEQQATTLTRGFATRLPQSENSTRTTRRKHRRSMSVPAPPSLAYP